MLYQKTIAQSLYHRTQDPAAAVKEGEKAEEVKEEKKSEEETSA